jgi:hypothetical protein
MILQSVDVARRVLDGHHGACVALTHATKI